MPNLFEHFATSEGQHISIDLIDKLEEVDAM